MKYGKLTLGQIEAIVNKLGGEEGAEAFLRGELVASPYKTSSLLQYIATVKVSGAKRFVAKDHLAVANICWMTDDFRRFFLGKIERNVEETNLAFHSLKEASNDASILSELGGDRAEISLAHFFEFLKKQARGEHRGLLLTNGYANIAYVRGIYENLWVVSASWANFHNDWHVDSSSVGNSRRGIGSRVVSSGS